MRIRRVAHTLAELLVVMSLTGAATSVALGAVHQIFHQGQRSDAENAMNRTVERLSARLRADIHQSESARLPEADTLALSGASDVQYAIVGSTVERTENAPGRPVHRDAFVLPENCRIRFDDTELPGRVAIVIEVVAAEFLGAETTTISSEATRLVSRIEGAVGKNQRFQMDRQGKRGTQQ